MNVAADQTLDVVEELRLRRWARVNHVPLDDRDLSWHEVVLDEMARKDTEMAEEGCDVPFSGIAPLGEHRPRQHAPHRTSGPRFMASPQRSTELHYT